MERYNKDRTCPKCGSDKLVNSYYAKGAKVSDANSENYWGHELEREIIRQCCTNCHYQWDVRPIDPPRRA